MAILEACAVIGVIAEVIVTIVIIAREVTVRAEEVSAKAAVSIVIAAKTVVPIVVTAKAGAVRFGPAEAAHMRTSEASHRAAAGMFATKSAPHAPAAESTASSMTTAATESPASSMTAATTADRPGGHGIRPQYCTECDGDEEDHDLPIGFCLIPVDSRMCFIVVTPKVLRVLRRSCSPRTGSIVLLLHSLLRGIQEWIPVTWPI
jgi:hypothetical protein